jgi:hypothetical protein
MLADGRFERQGAGGIVGAMRLLIALAASALVLAGAGVRAEDAPVPGPAITEPAGPDAPVLDLALAAVTPGRRLPWDRLDEADYALVLDVVREAVVAQQVRDIAFRSRKAVFDFLIEHPDFAADLARMLREGRYRLRRIGEAYEAEDGRGVRGRLRQLAVDGDRRLFYLEGRYDPPALPTLTGRLVLLLETEHTEGPDGITYCDMRVTGFLALDQTLPAVVVRVARSFSEAQVDRRVRRFFRHVAAVSRRAYDDPEGLADDMERRPGLDRDRVDRFRAILLEGRLPVWAEPEHYRLLDG